MISPTYAGKKVWLLPLRNVIAVGMKISALSVNVDERD
jgi:hypothetical protein